MFDCVIGYHLSSHCIHYSSPVLPITFEMAHQIELLTPFNYHQWKADMVVMLRTKGLFRLIEEAEEKPNSDKDKAKYMNRLDESHGHLLFSVSKYLWFHILELKTPKLVWDKLASLFDKHDEMRIHQLENDLMLGRAP